MDKEEVKRRMDFDKIREVELETLGIDGLITERNDYFYDDEGHNIMPINPVEMKIINKIKDLEARVQELEKLLEEVKR